MKLPKKTIKEIAEYLDCGLICYINKETKKIHPIVDIDQSEYYETTGEVQEGYEDIQNNFDKYIEIEKMSSREGFKIMEGFIDEVTNQKIKKRLIYALNNRRPFQNFKYEINFDENIRQQWFNFKEIQYIEWVEQELEHRNME